LCIGSWQRSHEQSVLSLENVRFTTALRFYEEVRDDPNVYMKG